jgi:transitional endoplasmic reticulum ATPase
MTKKEFVETLRKQREKFEKQPAGLNENLARNGKKIAEYLGLKNAEREILVFTVVLQEDVGLQEIMNTLGEGNVERLVFALSVILALPRQEVCDALSRQGLLGQSGLLKVGNIMGGSQHLVYDHLELLEGLANALQEPEGTIETLLEYYFTPASNPELDENNYRHVGDHFALVKAHIQHACEHHVKGVNILVYGPPGTGKSQFAKTVTKTIGCKLYEVSIGGEERPFDEPQRLRAFQLAQQVLARQKNTILLFDEIDSLLENSGFHRGFGGALNLKASINNSLENNQVPAIWIANDIRHAESAFVRRFDIALHLDHPPRSTRLEILTGYLEGLSVSQDWLELLADNKNIAPAVIARAVGVVQCQKMESPQDVEKKLEILLESTLMAMGYPRQPVVEAMPHVRYCLDAVNSDHDLHGIVQGLQRQGEGRLCLYGASGTGKTEFGRYLAKELDRPLLVKRGSDLLGPYLGQTEANIANMFYEATYEKAVLMLDEADSFLRDRSGARHTWEVTQVNELLTQIERHNGVFVCSTNLMDCFDQASLRRFDLKIKFDYLKSDQAWSLFVAVFEEEGGELENKKQWRCELEKCRFLTPGDFAVVVRKARISGLKLKPELIIRGLKAEIAFKQPDRKQHIGFLANRGRTV